MNKRTWLLVAIVALATLTISGVAGFGLSTSSAAAPTGVVAQAPSGQSSLSATEPGNSDPFGISNFNCADIAQYNIDKQLNLRADAIMENCTGQKSASAVSDASSAGQVSPDAYGGTDVSVKPAAAGLQSETFSWRNGSTVVVFYNDLTSGSTGKGSYSTDGGATFTLIPGDPFGTGHGANFGDPAVVYDVMHGKWIGTWLASGCGGQGVAAWTSTNGITWTAGGCRQHQQSGRP